MKDSEIMKKFFEYSLENCKKHSGRLKIPEKELRDALRRNLDRINMFIPAERLMKESVMFQEGEGERRYNERTG